MKIFKIETNYGQFYAIDNDSTAAHKRIREWLYSNYLGSLSDQAIADIKLVADLEEFAECGGMLFP